MFHILLAQFPPIIMTLIYEYDNLSTHFTLKVIKTSKELL